jgi:endonuclease YncB( thermonuclease family)
MAVAVACALQLPVYGQTPSDEAKVSAWATGGTSATAKPGDSDGKPMGGAVAMPYWQAPATPQAVIQGGAIPPGWQPQAIPYHGIGPDGKPITMYVAPTYVFTYQAGPPVLAVPGASRGVSRTVPGAPAAGWNYATSGAQPVNPALPAATVARYPSAPYQFPPDSRALTGTPVVPPAGSAAPPPPPQTWANAPAAPAPVSSPPPTQWVSSTPPPAAPPAAPATPSSGDWVTVVPPAVATAALAAGATTAGSQAADTTLTAVPQASSAGSTPAQPVSTGLSSPPSSVAAPHLWRVVGVQDGDTLTCLDETNQQQKIRLSDIDAPEIGQDYGKASREALAGLVFGKTVEVYDQGRDESGRWIARVMVNGVDVNSQLWPRATPGTTPPTRPTRRSPPFRPRPRRRSKGSGLQPHPRLHGSTGRVAAPPEALGLKRYGSKMRRYERPRPRPYGLRLPRTGPLRNTTGQSTSRCPARRALIVGRGRIALDCAL